MSKGHTPGPWTVGVYETTANFRQIERHACVCDPETRLVIAVTGPAEDEQSQKDADLMAAAPELYEAMYDIIASGAFKARNPSEAAIRERAMAALAKARGQ